MCVCVLMKSSVYQVKQLGEIITRFDMDGDGSLTLLELTALLHVTGTVTVRRQTAVPLLARLHANGNGTVEFEELANAISPELDEEVLMNREQLMEVFRLFDRDRNGYITAAELAGSMAKMGKPLTYKELTEMIKEADANGDGVISFHEFASVMDNSVSSSWFP